MRRTAALTVLGGVLGIMAPCAQTQSYPVKPIRLIVPLAPGGLSDILARTVAAKLTEGIGQSVNYLNQRPGDGGDLSVSPINLLTEHIAGASPITYTDVTLIAQLFNEYVVFSVKPDSPIKSGSDLVQRLKADPASVSFAVAMTP